MIKTTCPHCGEEVVIETPETTRRGKLAGLNLTEMTDDQLKREIINAASVLAKAKKRNAAEDTIIIAEARVAAAKAERDARPSMAKAVKVEAPVVENEEVEVNDTEAGEVVKAEIETDSVMEDDSDLI